MIPSLLMFTNNTFGTMTPSAVAQAPAAGHGGQSPRHKGGASKADTRWREVVDTGVRPHGKPDLQGVMDQNTVNAFGTAKELAAKEFYTKWRCRPLQAETRATRSVEDEGQPPANAFRREWCTATTFINDILPVRPGPGPG